MVLLETRDHGDQQVILDLRERGERMGTTVYLDMTGTPVPLEPQVPPLEGLCMFAGVGLCVPLTREPSWSTPGELGAVDSTAVEVRPTTSVSQTTPTT